LALGSVRGSLGKSCGFENAFIAGNQSKFIGRDLKFMMIQSQRLQFRPFQDQDRAFLTQLYQNSTVMKLIGGVRDVEKTELALQKFIKHFQDHGYGMLLAQRKTDGVNVGYCGCRGYGSEIPAEIGYIIDEPFWGEGYATEAVKAVSGEMRKFSQIDELIALIGAENYPSQKVIEKCGFLRDPLRDGTYHNVHRLFYVKKNS